MAAPTNITPPLVTGGFNAGDILTCSTGTWANSPTAFTYQWKKSGVGITGAKSSSFTIRQSDLGAGLYCEVRASNSDGHSVLQSNTVTPGQPTGWQPNTPPEPTWGEGSQQPGNWTPSTPTDAGWNQN